MFNKMPAQPTREVKKHAQAAMVVAETVRFSVSREMEEG